MLDWLRSRFVRRRRPLAEEAQPRRTASAASPSAATPGAEPPAEPTHNDVLAEVVNGAEPVDASAANSDLVARLAPEVIATALASRSEPTSFPTFASKLIDLLEQPDVDLNELVKLIHQNMAVAARLIEIANSAAFALPQQVTTVRDAVRLLGLREVGTLAIGVAGASLFEMRQRSEFDLFSAQWTELFHEAMTNAFTAGWLGLQLDMQHSDRALLGGMMQEIGRVVGLRTLAGIVVDGGVPRPSDAEVSAILDACAVAIGKHASISLGFPDYLQAVCDPSPTTAGPETHAAHLAAAIGMLSRGTPRPWMWASRARDCAIALGMTPRRLKVTITQRGEYAVHARRLFST